MTSKTIGHTIIGYIKLCALFQSRQWIPTGVRIRKHSIQVKIGVFFYPVWLWNWTDDLVKQYATSSMLLLSLCLIDQFKLEQQHGNAIFGPKSLFFLSHVTLKLYRWHWKTIFPCCSQFCAPFHSHQTIQLGVTVRKRQIWVTNSNLFVRCDLELWQMTLKNNRAPLICHIKLCASFHCHMWIQTGVTVQKRLN